ncbi:MAG: chemotaxis protein CheB [Deltaproteobacteria bacterium]|nr:chemotaxis protein CheB [Deltaproteobacteria bacterium]
MRLVAVGVSLGGLDAVRRLLRALPAQVRDPIVLVQHRRHDVGAGPLVSLLAECTKRVVVEPEDKTPLQEWHVFVAPAGYHLLVGLKELSLSMEPPVRYARPSIDVLFESAAVSFGEDLTAVVLTGASDDGAAGAAMVRKCGGRVFVQTPALSESAVAPLATKARLLPDLEGDIEVLAQGLLREVESPRVRRGRRMARDL